MGRQWGVPGAAVKVLFVHNWPTEFVIIDRDLLSHRFTLREMCYRFDANQSLAMLSGVAWADVVLCWFASWHTLLPVLLARAIGKRTVLIVGGYDTANLPEIR